MKVLLANPPCKQAINRYYEKYFIRAGSRWPHSGIKRKSQLPHYLPFPFFLAYSAALLLKEGFEVEVIDGVALDISIDVFKRMVDEINPDIILFETTTPTIDYDLGLVKAIKKKERPVVILTGTHVTVYSQSLMEEVKEIDYIILGEYEQTFLQLAKRIREGSGAAGLKGLSYRENGKVICTGPSPAIEPLDSLPFPARHLFPKNDRQNIHVYWDGFCQNRPALQAHASRGCPYRCSFCLWNQVVYNNGRYRMFSPSRVVDEMEELIKKYKAKEIYFDDDDFTVNKKHVLSVCREIEKRNLNVKWSCMGDAINLDGELIESMASAGCIGIKFGVESGSPEILARLGKPVDLDRVKDVVKRCNDHGIKTHATFTLGFLEETPETLKETYLFAKSLNVSSIQVSICTPFPGTRLFEEAGEKGFLKDAEWSCFDGKAKEIIDLPLLDSARLERYRVSFLRGWFISKISNPLWMFFQFRNLLRTLNGLGLKFFIKQVITVFEDDLQ